MDLNDYRKEIDRIDDQLIALFAQRMETAEKIAEYKKANGLRVLDARREKEKMREILDKTPDDLREYVSSLYSLIFELSRSRQSCLLGAKGALPKKIAEAIEKTPPLFPQEAAVACQGVEGAYSQIACEKIFKNPFIMYFKSFEAVFNAIDQGLCQYGILPIENSTAGSVNKVYDLMIEHNFSIVRTFRLKIDHNLLVNPGTNLADIKEVYSHEQAISQCGRFLQSLPGQKIIMKGNHDYWWSTANKMNAYLKAEGFDTLHILHNNSYSVEGYAICGTRGWLFDVGEPHDEKVMNREIGRLRMSLDAAEPGLEKLVFLHYPPVYTGISAPEIVTTLKEYGIRTCYYGHLHGNAIRYAVQGEVDGIRYKLVSADGLRFCPYRIN